MSEKITLTFPRDKNQRYYSVHYRYVLNVFKQGGFKINFEDLVESNCTRFIVLAKGKRILFDFYNFLDITDRKDWDYYFKFHYYSPVHNKYPKMFPFGTVSFYDWNEYEQLREEIKYKAIGERILNNQRPHAGAKQRRTYVQNLLRSEYGSWLDTQHYERQDFWKLINNCLVSVCVPGCRNDSLDRGQFQYMAFGCCTISPNLRITFPQYLPLVPNVHYIECQPDYSDLVEKIEWCRSNRNKCIEIGTNARKLFEMTSTPEKLCAWFLQIIS